MARNVMGVAAALVLAGFAAQAAGAAETVVISHRGVVSEGSFVSHGSAFGVAAGGRLDGLAFVARYTVTVPTPGAYYDSDGATYEYTYGGSAYGRATLGPATLTINGVTVAVGGFQHDAARYDGYQGNYDEVFNQAASQDIGGGITRQTYFSNYAVSYANDLTASHRITDATVAFNRANPNHVAGGFFTVNDFTSAGTPVNYAYGQFDTRSVTISALGAVPEPSAWALLILGFGATGGAMRAARRKTAAVTHA